jgi:hypothetical protein
MTRSSAMKGLSFPLSPPRQPDQRGTVSIKESICESPSRYEVAVLILLMSVLLCHRSHEWRGPGIYFVPGDGRTVVVAFAPY